MNKLIMEDKFGFPAEKVFIEEAKRPIRSKSDLQLLLKALEALTSHPKNFSVKDLTDKQLDHFNEYDDGLRMARRALLKMIDVSEDA